MQAAASLCATVPLPLKGTKSSLVPRRSPTTLLSKQPGLLTVAAMATAPEASSTVDYTSPTSVFPAEACETIGGDACDVEMFPEVKPAAQASAAGAQAALEEVDREYLDYNEPKTVFPGEACDDLGGEFCEPAYQEGVYREQQPLAK